MGRDAEEIEKFPFTEHMVGKAQWIHDSKGLYSVKSGYKRTWVEKTKENYRQYSEAPITHFIRQSNDMWKELWKLHIQPRKRVFLWQAIRNILSTYSKLAAKGLDVVRGCYLSP